MSRISILEPSMVLNNGISNPLCSKKGLICSISWFTAKAIILSICSNLVSLSSLNKTGFSNELVQEVSLEELKEKATILSFHLPLNEETKHYYNDDFLASIKNNHILINASRGSIANTSTILKGLQNGEIMGACLDVLDEEKNINEVLHTNNNLIEKMLKFNVIITPHIAGYSHNATEKMSQELMDKIRF